MIISTTSSSMHSHPQSESMEELRLMQSSGSSWMTLTMRLWLWHLSRSKSISLTRTIKVSKLTLQSFLKDTTKRIIPNRKSILLTLVLRSINTHKLSSITTTATTMQRRSHSSMNCRCRNSLISWEGNF